MRRIALGVLVVVGWAVVGCKNPVKPPPKEDGGSNPPAQEIGRTPAGNPIPAENALQGDPTWMNGKESYNGQVWVYTSTDSLKAGETFGVKVSTSIDSSVTAQVFRMGDYGGAGARQLWSGGPYSTQKQADCPMTPATGLIECSWPDTFSVTVGSDWVSGLYVVKVTRSDGFRRFAPFVVRDSRAVDIVFSTAFDTDQAYNTFGGESLYADASGTMPNHKAYEVSYDRPYAAGNGLGKVFYLERPLVQLLERNGYNVTYVTNLDFVRFSDLVDGVPLIMHGAQDEYWAVEQRDQFDAALASGKSSLAFFGGNGAYWRTRVRSSSDGRPYRILVCYKNMVSADPQPNSTIRFRDPPNANPENALFGVMYEGWTLNGFPLVVKDPAHWLFEGTGLQRGDQLPGLIGFEYDRTFDNGVSPAGIQIAAESPAMTGEDVPGRSQTVSRELPGGHSVFSAGTIWWAMGLGGPPELADPRVQQMTLNAIEHGLAPLRSKRTDLKIVGTIPTPPVPAGDWARSVDSFVGAPGSGGYVDGPGAVAQFDGPTGLAVNAAGEIAVADTRNQRIRVIGADAAHTVWTVAGNGNYGSRNGPGAQATFRAPTGVAYASDGSIYVADSDSHVIRRIANDSPTYTVTTIAGMANAPGYADGPAAQAQFNRPTALVVDVRGNIFVADQAGNRIRMISADLQTVSTVAGSSSIGFADDANPLAAVFNNPSALAVAPSGDLYVYDSGNHVVRRISANRGAVATIAGYLDDPQGFADGTGAQARFRAQTGMALDGATILLADTGNHRIRKIDPGADEQSTSVGTIAGSGKVGLTIGAGDAADVTLPAGIVNLGGRRFAVTDAYDNVVRIITR